MTNEPGLYAIIKDGEGDAWVRSLFGWERIGSPHWVRDYVNIPTPIEVLWGGVKPDEPTGHFAVVEDVEGRRWVNWRDPRSDQEHERPWVLAEDSEVCCEYADIDVARVLSEGIQP